MSRRTNYFGLWERVAYALAAGHKSYDLQHFDMSYLANAMEDLAKLEAKLETARKALRSTACSGSRQLARQFAREALAEIEKETGE